MGWGWEGDYFGGNLIIKWGSWWGVSVNNGGGNEIGLSWKIWVEGRIRVVCRVGGYNFMG
jgi:hypothetical protein